MKIRADEHVAPSIVRAVRDIALSPNWELTHLSEAGDKGAADAHWATSFAQDGGHAILSADTDFLHRPHQVLAILQTGLRIIHLPAKWANAKGYLQAAHILLWWRRIEQTVSTMSPRECFTPPWNLKEDGRLLKVSVDFESARRKAGKANRRAE